MDDVSIKLILLNAPVKSGKRAFPEFCALLDRRGHAMDDRKHVFVSSFHRRADDNQRNELGQYVAGVFSLHSKAALQKCMESIREIVEVEQKRLVIHVDECDYGSGEGQNLQQVYDYARSSASVKMIMYSATHEEALTSLYFRTNGLDAMLHDIYSPRGRVLHFIPPSNFCGPRRFLDEGLVQDASSFFSTTSPSGPMLTDHGRGIVHEFVTSVSEHPERNVFLLRLTGMEEEEDRGRRTGGAGGGGGVDGGGYDHASSMKAHRRSKASKNLYRFLSMVADRTPELSMFNIIVDGHNKVSSEPGTTRVVEQIVQWSNPAYWSCLAHGVPTIIVFDQTASRSTELACHHRVWALHDFRRHVVYSSYAQAVLRVNHYIGDRYTEFQRIRMYCHVPALEYAAGMIDLTMFTNSARGGVTTVDVSPRIVDQCERRVAVDVAVYPCPEGRMSWDIIRDGVCKMCGVRFQNPFQYVGPDGRFECVLRGVRKVRTVDEVKTELRYGLSASDQKARISACYDAEGNLCIVVRRAVGVEETQTFLSKKSMYGCEGEGHPAHKRRK